MRTSKPKIAAKIIAVLVAAGLCNALLAFALEPYGSKSQVIWNDYAATVEQGDSIDTVLVGTSFIHNGIDPAAFDAAYGSSSYNLASPNQTLDESLAAVQTAYEDFGIERVILGISITELHRSSASNPASPYMRERSQAVGWAETAASIADQLFKLETLKSGESLNCLFPWVGNHVDPNPTSIMQNLRMRMTNMPVAEAAFVQDSAWTYEGRGYGAYGTTYNPDTELGFYFTKEFIEGDDGTLDENRVRTLEALCSFCHEYDIELIAIGVPMPVANIEYYGDAYFEQVELVTDLLAAHDVSYYDFNLATPALFEAQSDYFADYAHLNGTGASAFGSALGSFLTDTEARDNKDLFYSKDDFLASLSGISALLVETETTDGGVLATCAGLTGPSQTDSIEYRMLQRLEDGTWQTVRDWSSENTFLYERSTRGTFDIRIEARLIGSSAEFDRYREFTLYY